MAPKHNKERSWNMFKILLIASKSFKRNQKMIHTKDVEHFTFAETVELYRLRTN